MKLKLRFLHTASRRFMAAATLLVMSVSYGQEFTESNLPIFIITTEIDEETGQPMEIPDDPKIWADLKIIWNEDGSTNYVNEDDENALNYNGQIKIELRGSSSQSLQKKQYGWTTYDDEGEKQNVSLLGMPEENDWILNGLAFDASLIRDYLCYNLTRQMGQYATRTHYCEVILNGDYRGLYMLTEKIKDDSKRVNVEEITDEDNEGVNLTGGYITKADKTTGGDPIAWQMDSYQGWATDYIHELPKPEDVTTEQQEYIHGVFTELETAATNEDTDLTTGYPSIIDVPTFVDFMIINEFSSNVDAYQISTFFHKDRGGKLRAGPVWDFNLSLGLDVFGDRSKTDVWQFSNEDNEGSKFWTDLFNEDIYKCHFSKRWHELTAEGQPLNYESLDAMIDETVELIHDAAVRNGERWGDVEVDPDFEAHIAAMKTWIADRLVWVDDNIGDFDACDDFTAPALVISRIDYNPGEDEEFPEADDQEFIEITNAGTTEVDLTGYYISELGISYQFPSGSSIDGGEKIYLASNPEVFEAKYDITPFGQFVRNMSNKSQKLELSDGMGNVVDFVEYTDSEPWPDADGSGFFLQLVSTDLDNSLASSWTTGTTLGSDSFEIARDILVYPNPVNDRLSIQSATLVSNVAIYDIYGKLLQSNVYDTETVEVDFSRYATGIYIVKISSETGSATQKIVKR